MYYLVFGIFYLLSLLPAWLLRAIGSGIGWLLFGLIGYRQNVVHQNLQRSFPTLSGTELKQLEKQFFRHFTDTWMETIKMMSISRKQVNKMVQADMSLYQAFYSQGKSAQLMTGHFMNWEVYNMVVPDRQQLVWLGIYMSISSKVMERLFRYLRGRFGTVLIPAKEVRNGLEKYQQKPYLLGLGADQSPSKPAESYWMMFLNQPTAFAKGPARNAVKNQLPIIFTWLEQPCRGRYVLYSEVMVDDASQYSPEEITRLYVRRLEAVILRHSANYLWSHRRWKHAWKSEYSAQWIDDRSPIPTAG